MLKFGRVADDSALTGLASTPSQGPPVLPIPFNLALVERLGLCVLCGEDIMFESPEQRSSGSVVIEPWPHVSSAGGM
jgi:hypothetical protein